MLLRPAFLITAAASCFMTAAGAVKSRDFASIESALESVNELLLQINNQITSLNADNIATAGPALLQLGQNIQPLLGGFSQQIADSAPLTVDETNGLNTARTAFNQNINLTVSELISQKPLFDMVDLDSQVTGILQQVRDDAANLFGMLQSKLAPATTNSAVMENFSASLQVFQMAIDVFSGQAAVMPSPAAVPPMTGEGAINADGSCNCDVVCPAGSFM